ncbi:PREDICTED: zinc finger protein 676-like, partial [Chlamydotis macqueenii]|uniref:zinc finger protein 676-like n=1 Tax=Chlamydotis macqueenii TaxID=187382 RepID=UPI000529AC75
SDVFEIVLPITVFVLSDDDFLQDDAEEQTASLPELKEDDELEADLNHNFFLKSSVTPSNDSSSLCTWEESKTASDKDSSLKYSEEEQVAESVCSRSKSPLSYCCDAAMDKYGQNCVLPTSSCETELTEIKETSDRKECGGDDGCQKIHPLLSAVSEETVKTSRQLALAEISRCEEELVSVASVPSDGSQEKQPEIHKEMETAVEMEGPGSSKNGDNKANNRKRSKFEEETLSSLLEHDLKEEQEFTSSCSAPFVNRCSPTSDELLKDAGDLEVNASTSAESGLLSFHKKFHEQLRATANGYTNQSNEYRKSKIYRADSSSQDHVSLSLSGKKKDCLNGGMLPSEVDFEGADDVQNNKKMCSRKKFPGNSHGSNSLPIVGNRTEVPLNSHKVDTVLYKKEHLFSSRASCSQAQDDDAYHRFVENLKDTWPSSLSTFKMYRCQHCSYATAVHSDFKLHLKIHTDERPFVCKECNKTFKTSNHLQKHSLIHIKNGYEFGHCLHVDSRLENLELHHEMHVGACPERDFYSLEGSNGVHSLLGSEVCRVQPDVQRGKGNDLLAQSQPGFYQCAECEYATYILSNLELHVRTHTGEKPYSCSVCQKKFPRNGNLKQHLRIHTGEKPFKCGQCAVAFRTSSHLKRHLLTHLKLRCRRCKFSTLDKRAFQKHVKTHQKKYKCGKCNVVLPTKKLLEKHKQQYKLGNCKLALSSGEVCMS